MINHVYRLVSPRQFEVAIVKEELHENEIIVRPTYLSICAADQRYFTGSRDKEVLAAKLPMALIHEGVGRVVHDPIGEFNVGDTVVMIPNTPFEEDEVIRENYLKSTKFRSSGYDGYTQDYIYLRRDRALALPDNISEPVGAYTELLSIAMHGILRMEVRQNAHKKVYGVWGDGNLGFLTALILKNRYKDSKVIVFGKSKYKLEYMSFVDETYLIDEIPDDMVVDHTFECVGGRGAESAIAQIIKYIRPEGTISLLGVTEEPVEVETRMLLEKGLTMFGSSRSGREDFVETINFIKEHENVQNYLENLIGEIIPVKNIVDVIKAFQYDLSIPWGKTVMKWEL
jgi:ribitol-5-phosphate 2-dehydrogenase (NADP+)